MIKITALICLHSNVLFSLAVNKWTPPPSPPLTNTIVIYNQPFPVMLIVHKWKGLHFLTGMLPVNCQLEINLPTWWEVGLRAKITRPPCFGAKLSAAVQTLCTPLTQSAFRSLETFSPEFWHATSAVSHWCAVPMPSPVNKSRTIRVSFTFKSHAYILTTGISEREDSYSFPQTQFCIWQEGRRESERNFSFRGHELKISQWHYSGPHTGCYWACPSWGDKEMEGGIWIQRNSRKVIDKTSIH